MILRGDEGAVVVHVDHRLVVSPGNANGEIIEGRKETFYLTTHSTHFYLRLYGVRHMFKDHSDSEKGNLLPPHRLLLSINSKGSFICIIPQRG